MTNLKHTPAPWLVEDATVYALEHSGWRKGVEQLCNRFTASISGNPRTISKEELISNAQLIAAAPELLEALQLAVRQNQCDMLMTGEELRICEAAINKALGETK